MPENWIEKAKRWLGQITELGLLLIALAIVLQILVGPQLAFFDNVVSNLINIISQLGDNGVVGLIAIAIILWLFAKRNPG
jgi:hypothetical protein